LISGPYGPRDRGGIWVFPLDGRASWKLIDDANFAALSPDDSKIAYLGERGAIWVVNVSGKEARRIVAATPGNSFSEGFAWSPDGRRVAYGKRKQSEFSIESYDLYSGQTKVILSDRRVGSFCWPRNGRIIYVRQEEAPNEKSANLWDVRVDLRTARVLDKPRRLTNWGGYLFDVLSADARGTRLSFSRKRFRSTLYVGDLEAGGARLSKSRRLSFDEWMNWPTAWSRDSRSVLFTSDREGHLDIFRQDLEGPAPLAIVEGGDERRDARFSPDGLWILYLSSANTEGHTRAGEGRLMRVAVGGGAPQSVIVIPGYPTRSRVAVAGTSPGDTLSTGPRFRCPSAPKSLCVLSERIGNHVIFTAFEPFGGRKRELARIDGPIPVSWDLSPDGQWIAFVWRRGDTHIRLLSLAGQPSREISLGDWKNLQSVAWAADGKAVFVTGWASKNPPLLHVSLNGEITLLHNGLLHLEHPVPSPDGRYLAFGENTMESNVWLVENLR
jgi:Tol biopolymer transport system component